MLARYDWGNAPALRRLLTTGTELRPFPVPVLDACHKAAQELYAEMSTRSPSFRKALDSQRAFAADQLVWWQAAENFYDTYMISRRPQN
jgi:TRAP-type mannitol/chloroaromatic compound transport system substrate-binding protein